MRIEDIRYRRGRGLWTVVTPLLLAIGCAQPTYFPDLPVTEQYVGGATRLSFDLNQDGAVDYRQSFRGPLKRDFEFLSKEGTPTVIHWDELDPAQERHLFLLLDGVPYDLMRELWTEGRFRLFHRPGLLVSTLPSLTDVAFGRILDTPPPEGYESAYFCRAHNRLTDGTRTYLRGDNETWRSALDYRLTFIEDAIMYIFPKYVFQRELENARRKLRRSKRKHPVVYLLSTDGLCHMRTRSQALDDLRLLDRWIERVVYEHGARLQLTMLADHGNSFVPSHALDLKAALEAADLRVTDSLHSFGDVVLPEFGLIDFAALYVHDEATLDRAIDVCASLDGVEILCYRRKNPEGVVVVHGDEHALIERRQAPLRYRYTALRGDPLLMRPLMERLRNSGELDDRGFATDGVLLRETYEDTFPDAAHRIWEALTDNTRNAADLILSLTPGYHVGDPSLDAWVDLRGTHGGLRKKSTNTFIMSTAFESPKYLRPTDVLPLIRESVPWTPRAESRTQSK